MRDVMDREPPWWRPIPIKSMRPGKRCSGMNRVLRWSTSRPVLRADRAAATARRSAARARRRHGATGRLSAFGRIGPTTTVESVRRRLWHRMPWLVVGLIGAMISAGLMAAFEAQLNATLAVAYFVPGIVYLADAVGTQSETLAIRGLSVGIGIRSILATGSPYGAACRCPFGRGHVARVALMTDNWRLAAAVALAVLAASTIATVVALLLPWLFKCSGRTPRSVRDRWRPWCRICCRY